MWAANGTALHSSTATLHSSTATIEWHKEDLLHNVNNTMDMRKLMAVTTTATEVWERQNTGKCSIFVFCIMADLFYANYNITGSCSI
jgi:hypothetical protein